MFRTTFRPLLSAFILAAIACSTVVADEPANAPPPATSIKEWRTTQSPAPAATTAPARSIREWRTAANPTPEPCAAASPLVNPSAGPVANPPAEAAANAASPTKPITISLKSSLRQGRLVVLLDDVPIFNQKFEKPLLVLSQITTWDPLKVTPGVHRLSARVHGTKKTYYSKTYDLQLMSTKEAVLRFVMQGDNLVVDLGS